MAPRKSSMMDENDFRRALFFQPHALRGSIVPARTTAIHTQFHGPPFQSFRHPGCRSHSVRDDRSDTVLSGMQISSRKSRRLASARSSARRRGTHCFCRGTLSYVQAAPSVRAPESLVTVMSFRRKSTMSGRSFPDTLPPASCCTLLRAMFRTN